MAADAILRPAEGQGQGQGRGQGRGSGGMRFSDALIVLALLGLTSAFSLIFARNLGETRLTMVYLAPVLIAAAWLGVWPGFFAAIGAVGLLNFLYAVPHFSLVVAQAEDFLTLLMFFLVAATTGILAGKLREQRDAARAHARALQLLSAASGQLHSAETREAVLAITRDALAALTGRAVVVMERKDESELALILQSEAAPPPQHADLYAAELALARGQAEPAAAPGWNGAAYTFLPVRMGDAGTDTGSSDIVLGILRQLPGWRVQPDQEAAVEVLCQHSALALQRLHLGDRVAAERERASMETLRAALLSSLSHDLRSPLAGILGSVTTINELGADLSAGARRELLIGIEAETRRLAAYVTNLLQLTRLQSGSPPEFQLVSLPAVAGAAEERLRQIWPEAQIRHRPGKAALIRADAVLLEQAIYNLLDNAIRHGGGEISLSCDQNGDRVRLTIADQGSGPGLPGGAGRPGGPGAVASGTGLGLPVSRAIATALGGELRSEETPGGRAVTLVFSVAGAAATAAESGASAAAPAAPDPL